ncbi:NUDIX domain-containing protein [bacterium]|nr:NUDIX domain-containing protein [bacterium]
MNFRINVRAIIPHNGKLLLAKNKNLPGYWCLPGGGLDEGEELKEGLSREVFEETGIKPKVGKLLFIQQIGDGEKYNYPEFFFLVENGSDYEDLDLAKASHASEELESMEFVDVSREPILPEFLSTRIPELFEKNFDVPVEYIFP